MKLKKPPNTKAQLSFSHWLYPLSIVMYQFQEGIGMEVSHLEPFQTLLMSGECMLLGSVWSQQRFGVTDIKVLGASQLSGLGRTML